MQTLTTVAEVQAFSKRLAREGKTLALVPTMGFLHEGHQSLMREGAKRADVVAATIFVNPTQFGPNEDLSKYPRDLKGDLQKCEAAGASVVFAPVPAEVYPEGFQTFVEVERVSQGLCGASRPGHFRGVATVVTKLLAMFRPDLALFGEKDFQQLAVIRTLNADLNLGVNIIGMPTVREADGLAMSSRNTYLSADERQRALSISKSLREAQAKVRAGERSVPALVEGIRAALTQSALREDYVEIRDSLTLEPLQTLNATREARVLVAVFAGKTRLIDNMPLVSR